MRTKSVTVVKKFLGFEMGFSETEYTDGDSFVEVLSDRLRLPS
jgi:hypothetical protein